MRREYADIQGSFLVRFLAAQKMNKTFTLANTQDAKV